MSRKSVEATGICSYELVAADGTPLPAYEPGAHVDVEMGGGQVRQYSLCTPYRSDRYVIGVKLDPNSRGGSAYMHAHVAEGSMLHIGMPRNQFPLAPEGGRFILLAGGIGITPLMCMAAHLREVGRPFELHYFVQSKDHAAFGKVIGDPGFVGHESVVHHHIGLQPSDLPPVFRTILGEPAADRFAYMCGPAPFMQLVRDSAPRWGPDRLRFEYFAADPQAPTPVGGLERFTVHAAVSGGDFDIGPGESIVSVLGRHGISIETSCEQGICGTCLTRVADGVPCHLDGYLTDAERSDGRLILPCVSRSFTPRIVLEV